MAFWACLAHISSTPNCAPFFTHYSRLFESAEHIEIVENLIILVNNILILAAQFEFTLHLSYRTHTPGANTRRHKTSLTVKRYIIYAFLTLASLSGIANFVTAEIDATVEGIRFPRSELRLLEGALLGFMAASSGVYAITQGRYVPSGVSLPTTLISMEFLLQLPEIHGMPLADLFRGFIDIFQVLRAPRPDICSPFFHPSSRHCSKHSLTVWLLVLDILHHRKPLDAGGMHRHHFRPHSI